MKLNEAIEILEYHQRWRLGKIDEMKYTPKQLTKALDVVLKIAIKNAKPNMDKIKDVDKFINENK